MAHIKNIIRTVFLPAVFLLVKTVLAQDLEFVAQHEGMTSSIAQLDAYVYFNSGGNINVLKENAPDIFEYKNRFHTGTGYCTDMLIDKGLMYVSTYGRGVVVYDLIDPENPHVLGQADVYKYIEKALVCDSVLIACRQEYALLYDISDPHQVSLLSDISFLFNRNATFALNNHFLYGFTQNGYSGPQFIECYDISVPAAPTLAASYQLHPDWQAPWPDAIETGQNNLFVALSDTIKVFDISDPATIALRTKFPLLHPAGEIRISGSMLYVAMPDHGISVYDISDVFAPEIVGYYDQPSEFDEFDVSDDYIFSALINNGFRIANKTDLSSITDIYDYTHTDAVYSACVNNHLAYLGMQASGLEVVDISNPTAPVSLGRLQNLSGIKNITFTPGYLFCTNDADSLIHIVNVSDPQNPAAAGSLAAGHGFIMDYCISDDRLYVLDSTRYIHAYDISNPETPELIFTAIENGTGMGADSSFLILHEATQEFQWESKLKLFTIVNDNLVFQHELTMGEYLIYGARQIRIEYPWVYVRASRGLLVLKIDNNHLTLCDEITFQGMSDFSKAMSCLDNFVYFSGHFYGTDQILVIDRSTPEDLQVVQNIFYYAGSLAPFENYLCFAAHRSGYFFYGKNITASKNIHPDANPEISCRPNPCSQFTTFRISAAINRQSAFRIFNPAGNLIHTRTLPGNSEFVFDTRHLPAGIYFYQLETDTNVSAGKFIVK